MASRTEEMELLSFNSLLIFNVSSHNKVDEATVLMAANVMLIRWI